nr:MAG TPA: hypothetical protein [Caudoviricetes sp.]
MEKLKSDPIGGGSRKIPTPLHRPTTLKYPRSGLKLEFLFIEGWPNYCKRR